MCVCFLGVGGGGCPAWNSITVVLLLVHATCMCECAYINVLCGDIHVCVCVWGGGGGGEKVDVN